MFFYGLMTFHSDFGDISDIRRAINEQLKERTVNFGIVDTIASHPNTVSFFLWFAHVYIQYLVYTLREMFSTCIVFNHFFLAGLWELVK